MYWQSGAKRFSISPRWEKGTDLLEQVSWSAIWVLQRYKRKKDLHPTLHQSLWPSMMIRGARNPIEGWMCHMRGWKGNEKNGTWCSPLAFSIQLSSHTHEDSSLHMHPFHVLGQARPRRRSMGVLRHGPRARHECNLRRGIPSRHRIVPSKVLHLDNFFRDLLAYQPLHWDWKYKL